MATEALSTSRRALIGALVVSPALVASPSAFATHDGRAQWNGAVAAYDKAVSRLREFDHQTLRPAAREWDRLRASFGARLDFEANPVLAAAWTKYRAIEERSAELLSAVTCSVEHVVSVRAPDGPALARKMEIACQEHDDVYEFDAEWVAIFIADARRLGGMS